MDISNEEFNEFKRSKYKRKKEVNGGDVKKKKEVEEVNLDVKTNIEVRGKSSRKNVKDKIKCGGYFKNLPQRMLKMTKCSVNGLSMK